MRDSKTMWGKKAKKNHDTKYENKPVMFQVRHVLEGSIFKTSKCKPYKI